MNNHAYGRWGFVFPGQGSQRAGMGKDLYKEFPETVVEIFETADSLMSFPLSKICCDGSEEELRRTEITQPAIFLMSYAAYRVISDRMPEPAAVAGHSLGEYAALAAAGVLEWTDALHLVRRRGELMADINTATPGTMVVALGMTAPIVERLCAMASAAAGSVVEVANYNEPTQTVVSGTLEAVAVFLRLAKPELPPGGKLKKLDVGAPFHCSLMAAVEAEFATELATVKFRDPRIPLVANTTGRFVTTAAEARDSLRRQLAGPVRWTESLSTLVEFDVSIFAEIGPGRVLTGINRRTYPDLDCHSASDARRIGTLLATGALRHTA